MAMGQNLVALATVMEKRSHGEKAVQRTSPLEDVLAATKTDYGCSSQKCFLFPQLCSLNARRQFMYVRPQVCSRDETDRH